jgi:hypothetical protein
MFVDATVFPCRLDRSLHAASIHRAAGRASRGFIAARVGKEKAWVSMGSPEAAQVLECWIRKWNIAIFPPFPLAHMNTPMFGINISNLHAKAFSKPKTHAVYHKEKDAVAKPIDAIDQSLHFLSGWNIGQRSGLWRIDNLDPFHLAAKDMTVEKR